MIASLRHGLPLRWQALTREARDTLWLLAALALVLAPHLPRLPWWAGVGTALALVYRAYLAWRDAPLPSRWWLMGLLLASLILTWLTYRTLIGREPGITLVVILTTLKALELRARRDALVCLYLGFFLIFTQFIYSQGLGTAALMLVAVWGLLSSLILGQRPLGRPPLREVGAEALRAMLWGLPLMLVLFVLFPRIGPLWSLPTEARARTGLSETLQLGEVSELSQDDSIAMRLAFQGPRPQPSQMYMRGPTLDDFDGRTWTPARFRGLPPVEFKGPAWRYTATVEPTPLKVLPLIEGTATAQPGVPGTDLKLFRTGLDWVQLGGMNRRIQVDAVAYPLVRQGPLGAHNDMSRWLRLPPGYNPRTLAWARQWRQQAPWTQASARPLSAGVLAYIRQQDYRYTLSPGGPSQPTSPHLIDDFWMDRRAGFCEHFATAFTVVMRAMGVPARVVTGYQGADLNPLDGQYIVRNSHAHAWAEVWSPEEGWIRVDPTAAVAPERVEQPLRVRPLAGLPGPLGEFDPAALRRLRDAWDAVDHRWNVWVLQYARGQQMDLMRQLGWSQPDWTQLAQVLAVALSALALGGSLVAWLGRERPRAQPWLRPMMDIHHALSALVPPPAGPVPAPASTWQAHLARHWRGAAPPGHEPALSATHRDLLRTLNELDALRYGPVAGTDQARLLRHQRQALVRRIQAMARSLRADAAHSSP